MSQQLPVDPNEEPVVPESAEPEEVYPDDGEQKFGWNPGDFEFVDDEQGPE
jgi:hypothetical protein